jgi:type VI secretion system protein ImpA
MTKQLVTELLEPIPGGHPGGTDLAYFKEFDAIREARRADDPTLAQGAWETEIKAAQWPLVRELCEEALRKKSKDFQIACWYTEALTRLEGFSGLDTGLKLLNGLLTDFWEFAYPELDPTDLEERISKFEWLDTQMPHVLRSVPMTSAKSGGYSWLQWEESRSVENLGARDAQAKEAALAEGKLAADTFDKAADASGGKFYEKLLAQLIAVQNTHAELETLVDRAFGADSPSLRSMRDAIAGCVDLANRLAVRTGAKAQPAPIVATPNTPATAPIVTQQERPAMNAPQFSGPIQSRSEAVNQLREISRFFRDTEPHSPVALLADRAARWAEMPLEQWLSTVIKDDATLGQLRELLDWERGEASN